MNGKSDISVISGYWHSQDEDEANIQKDIHLWILLRNIWRCVRKWKRRSTLTYIVTQDEDEANILLSISLQDPPLQKSYNLII